MTTLASHWGSNGSTIPSFAKALERLLNPYEDPSLRVPFVMYSDYRVKRGMPSLKMLMNPQTVTFRQNKRISRRDTRSGATFFHWTDQSGRNNDILELDFAGQTGNISLRRGGFPADNWVAGKIDQATDWLNEKLDQASDSLDAALGVEPQGVATDMSGAGKLAQFWNLYQLTTEPVMDPYDGRPSYSYIQYISPLFGNTGVTFVGHFSRVLEITDDSNEPFNKNYSFGFTAIGSQPSMSVMYTVISENLSQEFLTGQEWRKWFRSQFPV